MLMVVLFGKYYTRLCGNKSDDNCSGENENQLSLIDKKMEKIFEG